LNLKNNIINLKITPEKPEKIMKTIDELKQEINQEAEKNIMYAISERRTKISYYALIASILILVVYFLGFAKPQPLDRIYISAIKINNLILTILLLILTVAFFTGLPVRVIGALKIKKNTKFNYRVQTEYLRLVAERIEFYPEDIKDLEKSIEDAKSILKEREKECEEDIQGFEKTIENYVLELKLLKKLNKIDPKH
jgi:t-SNARE complex subunit (syntaxin)